MPQWPNLSGLFGTQAPQYGPATSDMEGFSMTPEADYWERPIMGGIPLHRFATMAGLLANAISPDSMGGRMGRSAASLAGNYGNMALHGEQNIRQQMMLALAKAAQERQRLKNLGGFLSRVQQPQSSGFGVREGQPEAPGATRSAFGVPPVMTSLREVATGGGAPRQMGLPEVSELFGLADPDQAKFLAEQMGYRGLLPTKESFQTEQMFKMLQDPRMRSLIQNEGPGAGSAQPTSGQVPTGVAPLELGGLQVSPSGPQVSFKPRGVDESLKDPFFRESRALGLDPRSRLSPEQVQQVEQSLTQRKSAQELEQYKKQQEISHSFPEKPTSVELRKQAGEEQGIAQLVRLKSFYSPNLVGPVAGRLLQQRVKYGRDLSGAPLTKADANFMALTKTIGNAVIQAISGAAVSAQEAERLMAQIPNELNPPTAWEANYQQSLLNIQELNSLMKQKTQGGGGAGTRTLSPQEEADAYLRGR